MEPARQDERRALPHRVGPVSSVGGVLLLRRCSCSSASPELGDRRSSSVSSCRARGVRRGRWYARTTMATSRSRTRSHGAAGRCSPRSVVSCSSRTSSRRCRGSRSRSSVGGLASLVRPASGRLAICWAVLTALTIGTYTTLDAAGRTPHRAAVSRYGIVARVAAGVADDDASRASRSGAVRRLRALPRGRAPRCASSRRCSPSAIAYSTGAHRGAARAGRLRGVRSASRPSCSAPPPGGSCCTSASGERRRWSSSLVVADAASCC